MTKIADVIEIGSDCNITEIANNFFGVRTTTGTKTKIRGLPETNQIVIDK